MTKRTGGLSTYKLIYMASGWDGLPDNSAYGSTFHISFVYEFVLNKQLIVIYKVGAELAKPNSRLSVYYLVGFDYIQSHSTLFLYQFNDAIIIIVLLS